MPSDPAATLTSLLRQSSLDDHDEILKAANAALKADKSDLQAQHTRVVALLKLDRFDDALRALSEGGAKLEDACNLEKAYALYKTGKLDEASAILKSSSDRSFNHLAAQVAYRAERFGDAATLYKTLSERADAVGEENDLVINALATAAQQDWRPATKGTSDDSFEQPSDSADTFELAYNVACGCVARGELSKASVLLQRAGRLCDAADDLSDEDKQLEMVPIMVQQAYVYARLGKVTEALRLHKQLASFEFSDDDTDLIAKNNLTTLQDEETNAFRTLREIQTASSQATDAKLFGYQDSLLRRNHLAMALRAQKFPGIVRKTDRLLDDDTENLPAPDAHALSVFNVAATSLDKTATLSLKKVLPELEKRPTDVGAALTAVQLRILAGKHDRALEIVESLFTKLQESQGENDLQKRYSPGLVALAVALYRHQNRLGCVRTELAKASSYWHKQEGRQSSSLLRGAGTELLKSSNEADQSAARAAFDKLCAQPTRDPLATAGFVASFAKKDALKTKPYLDTLPSIDDLVDGVDASALLSQGVASLHTSTSALSGAGQKRSAQDTTAARQAKRRRNKPAKNIEEGKKPDPERWMPLRDRSTYRPKNKKGKKKANESTQGGYVKEEETIELAGGAGSVKVEKAAGQSSSNNNKKKKKGKK